MKFKKVITRQEVVPPFYGIAWSEYERNTWVCYPLGINLIAILIRDFYFWIKNPKGS